MATGAAAVIKMAGGVMRRGALACRCLLLLLTAAVDLLALIFSGEFCWRISKTKYGTNMI